MRRQLLAVAVAVTLISVGLGSSAQAANEQDLGKSVNRAATTVFKDRLYVAWTDQLWGIPSGGIQIARRDLTWEPVQRIPSVDRAESGPGLAGKGDRMYVAWRVGTQLFMSSSADLVDWTPRVRAAPDGVADSSPSLAVFGDRM
jgi:hypothetical protein